ncbi:Rad2 nuclease [Coemansia interrupta]|uniref:Rad2 nuclease n=1 Tax=Coemansia interrupta TaxID=1126814 RepID=A0A9W8LGT2_9FUNG|nr:Rad2 nuclease [Coemansia interrupta]
MGISGLIPLLSQAQTNGHIKQFSGQTVGIDSYIWLYKGAFGCAADLALAQPTTKFITFFMTRARMLRHYGVEPLFVFDGGMLPSKRHTEMERQQRRQEKRQLGIKLWNKGSKKQAFEQFTRSLEVTPEMAKEAIKALEEEGFKYIVAPFEADAQLAYLERTGVITAAISEDSDLIVFGCRKIIFKLDQYGSGRVFDRSRLAKVTEVDISDWTDAQIRHMCIISGCDYVASIPGIGLKKAYRYVARSSSLAMAVELMRADGLAVPDNYEAEVTRADLTFMYQRVYSPSEKCLDFVGGPPAKDAPGLEDMPFLGDMLEAHVAEAIATAKIDPTTKMPYIGLVESTLQKMGPSSAHVVPAESAGAVVGPTTASTNTIERRVSSPISTPVTRRASTSRQNSASESRTKNLMSFWAKPKPKASSITSATPDNGVSAIAVQALEVGNEVSIMSDQNDTDDEVQVKFRLRDANTSGIVVTSNQSRFFSSSAKASQSNGPPDLSVDPDELPNTQTQVETTSDSHNGEGISHRLLANSTLVDLSQVSQAETVTASDAEIKGAYYLFDQFLNVKRAVPKWAVYPRYVHAKD